MGLLDKVKRLFTGDTTTTMGFGKEDVIFKMPQIANPYEDFDYPYTPMQRTKRFPKIVNAYAIKARANADIGVLREHRDSITRLLQDYQNMAERVSALEGVIAARVFTETAISARQTLSTDRTHNMSASVETTSTAIMVGIQSIYAWRVGETDQVSGAITIRDGWSYTKEQLPNNRARHTITVNVQNVYSGGQTTFELVVKPVFYETV